jgi:excisionase family DNA binding protein
MTGFHSHDDDFLYEFQRGRTPEPAHVHTRTQQIPSIHRKTTPQTAAEAGAAASKLTSPGSDLPPGFAFTLKDAAAYSGVKVSFLRRAIRDGRLPAKLAGNHFIILRDDLVRFISLLPAATSPRK